uniref:Uncharacterized protein n=1 Tax=Oryza brachyantha TaxID=4533 RepID=J3MMR7_ORYBR
MACLPYRADHVRMACVNKQCRNAVRKEPTSRDRSLLPRHGNPHIAVPAGHLLSAHERIEIHALLLPRRPLRGSSSFEGGIAPRQPSNLQSIPGAVARCEVRAPGWEVTGACDGRVRGGCHRGCLH